MRARAHTRSSTGAFPFDLHAILLVAFGARRRTGGLGSVRAFADYVFEGSGCDVTAAEARGIAWGSTVFVKLDYLREFVETVHRAVESPCVRQPFPHPPASSPPFHHARARASG